MEFKVSTGTQPQAPSSPTSTEDIELTPYTPMEFEKLRIRLVREIRPVKRFDTGIAELDKVIKGLPKGLTILYGDAGSGKTTLAREIAKKHKTLYFCCEVLTDSPNPMEFPLVQPVDYTRYLPNVEKAIRQLVSFVHYLKPEIVVIDSLTSFFSRSKKALPESDVREYVSKLHTWSEGLIPIIGVSEIRGTGFNRTTAGGEAVKHASSLLIEFDHAYVKYEGLAEAYKAEMGDVVYTMRVEKDKHGLANTNLHKVFYNKLNGDYKMVEL
jgi:predicted ATP-dependent serine protease